jgi:plasmid replication initiation protein
MAGTYQEAGWLALTFSSLLCSGVLLLKKPVSCAEMPSEQTHPAETACSILESDAERLKCYDDAAAAQPEARSRHESATALRASIGQSSLMGERWELDPGTEHVAQHNWMELPPLSSTQGVCPGLHRLRRKLDRLQSQSDDGRGRIPVDRLDVRFPKPLSFLTVPVMVEWC